MNTPTQTENGLFESSRITIMDGEVVTIATGFEARPGISGPHFEATGPFEISASRNAVIVHRAEIHDATTLGLFLVAMGLALEHLTRLAK